MKRERQYQTAFKAWTSGLIEVISKVMVIVKRTESSGDHEHSQNMLMALAEDAFKAGWDAAIDWCMQPEDGTGTEKESAGRE